MILFWSVFCCENSNKLKKMALEGKVGWALNVFTLGPMTYATLVLN